jgi:hypothetical protein
VAVKEIPKQRRTPQILLMMAWRQVRGGEGGGKKFIRRIHGLEILRKIEHLARFKNLRSTVLLECCRLGMCIGIGIVGLAEVYEECMKMRHVVFSSYYCDSDVEVLDYEWLICCSGVYQIFFE